MNAIFQLKSRIAFLAALLVATLPLSAQPDYVPSPEILKARSEFQDDKFGIMICWGIYSMMGDGEWVMNDKNLNWEEYAKLAEGFYPSKFNAAEWVSAIKASGARYINFVSRHHDSFSMFKSEASDFNIVDATPFGRDVLKELSDECHRQGIKLHIYYSQLDWRRPDYPAGGNTVFIPYAGNRLKTATIFSSGEKISFKSSKDGITLQFKDTPADEIDYIVELTFADSI